MPESLSSFPRRVKPAQLDPWQLRHLLHQAATLYRHPDIQRAALLHHLDILRQHSVLPNRLLYIDALAESLGVADE